MPRPPVLHVAPVLWSGAGSVITRLCEAQRSSRPVTLVTAALPGPEADWRAYRARLRKAGVEHQAIDFLRRDPAIFWAGVGQLSSLLQRLRPAVVHAHAGVPAAAAACARDLSGVPVRIIAQMYSWGVGRPQWMNRQDVWGFSRADRVVSSAREYSAQLVALGVPERAITYLPWGLPLQDLPYTPPREPRAGATIGFVGRLEPRKGQLPLVRAFAQLRRSMPGVTLELVGPAADPAYAEKIEAAIERAGLGDSVRVRGRVRDAVRIMRRWDLFVSLSSDEGQGLAILEAMALGVPVAALPVAGVGDFLVDGRNGVALPSGSPRAVAHALRQALTDPSRTAMAQRARRMVETRYDWTATVRRVNALYRG